MTQEQYQNYIKILRSELIPAMGCTEPIAVAFAAAKAREVLGCMPEAMVARCSGNIIKNVKSVIVPNSGNERGVEAAAVLGAAESQAVRYCTGLPAALPGTFQDWSDRNLPEGLHRIGQRGNLRYRSAFVRLHYPCSQKG